MPKAIIVYASWTGNSKEIAEILANFFEHQNLEVDVHECQQVDATAFLNADICVVSTYTFGSNGDLPDEIVDFYYDLGKLDLSGKVFGVLGSGEEHYGYYCKSVEDFDKKFNSTGAIRGTDLLKIELAPDGNDIDRIKAFSINLLKSYQGIHTK